MASTTLPTDDGYVRSPFPCCDVAALQELFAMVAGAPTSTHAVGFRRLLMTITAMGGVEGAIPPSMGVQILEAAACSAAREGDIRLLGSALTALIDEWYPIYTNKTAPASFLSGASEFVAMYILYWACVVTQPCDVGLSLQKVQLLPVAADSAPLAHAMEISHAWRAQNYVRFGRLLDASPMKLRLVGQYGFHDMTTRAAAVRSRAFRGSLPELPQFLSMGESCCKPSP
uniref:Uncharacterized protein n=1 Tax=Compsopogon caeruleus TaxID=31354 RepID=A0A7S1T8T3_9RHOD|mmetsp:Transcript_12818/g.26012  ORF Transcript_12818/g.26012 Transcript_12818/m.26012 type:complete len:229 (+) Transcript_12818:473-1159(+)|eukprot:CAMPEP_0184690086 /NCGR_PEP_ID=MMETSP0312-20130426/31022_1 /TAXON_ID=31354 /ORGANISM="Compsopogon coeruleus, Strain SAG 36.94" /LENGTH=228 /DNA_ID=CAMNT_0027147519 /DNA_START=845 /DNA_END=1531 /DNA_ORIENTATION=+